MQHFQIMQDCFFERPEGLDAPTVYDVTSFCFLFNFGSIPRRRLPYWGIVGSTWPGMTHLFRFNPVMGVGVEHGGFEDALKHRDLLTS